MTMGSNIVVMNEGSLCKLEHHLIFMMTHKNIFVAQFIGDPGMNIITLKSGMKIGFRPRNIHINNEDVVVNEKEDSILQGTILATENHGSERLYYVDVKIGKIYTKMHIVLCCNQELR